MPLLQTPGTLQVPGPRPTFPPLPEQCPQPGPRSPWSAPSRSCSEKAIVRTACQVPVRMSGPHLLAGGPRASHVTSLSLSFLICEMGIRTGNSWGDWKDSRRCDKGRPRHESALSDVLSLRVQCPPLHQPVPETILLPLIPSQGPPLYYGTCPIARLQNPSNAAGRCSCSPFHR